jgi:hypothetical protein
MATRNQQLPIVRTTVLVADLIKALERVRDAEAAEAKAAEIEYKKARGQWAERVRTHLRKKLEAVSRNFEVPQKRGNWTRDVGEWIAEGCPDEPARPNDVQCIRAKYDGLIHQLKLSADTKIKLLPEDFSRFMAGDASACRC